MGCSEFAPFAFAVYGLINSAVLGDLDTGYEYGKVALQLADQHPAPRVRGRANVQVGLFLRHWKEHLRQTPCRCSSRPWARGSKAATWSTSATPPSASPCTRSSPASRSTRWPARTRASSISCERNGLTFAEECVRAVPTSGARPARPPPRTSPLLEGEDFRESVSVPGMIAANNGSTLSLFHVLKLILQYVFDDVAGAAATAEKGEAFISAQLGQVAGIELNFFQSLALLALARDAAGAEKDALLAKVAEEPGGDAALGRARTDEQPALASSSSRPSAPGCAAIRSRALALFDAATSGAAEHGYACEAGHRPRARRRAPLLHRAGARSGAPRSPRRATRTPTGGRPPRSSSSPGSTRSWPASPAADGPMSPTITTTGSHGDTLIDARP